MEHLELRFHEWKSNSLPKSHQYLVSEYTHNVAQHQLLTVIPPVEHLTRYISSLPDLSILEVWLNEPSTHLDITYLTHSLADIVSAAPTALCLLCIHLDLRFWGGIALKATRSRTVFDALFGEELKINLERLPGSMNLRFRLWGDRYGVKLPGAVWWMRRLQGWIPQLKGRLEVLYDTSELISTPLYQETDLKHRHRMYGSLKPSPVVRFGLCGRRCLRLA